MNKAPVFLLLCLLAWPSCRRQALPRDENPKAHVTLKATGIVFRSATDAGSSFENGISEMAFFIFDSGGKLFMREDFSSPQPFEATVPPGTYSFRICTGDIPQNVSSLQEHGSYGQSFTSNGYSGGFCMGAEGEFSLGYNDERTIAAALHRNYCRMRVTNIRTSTEHFGQYPDLKALEIHRIFLMDVPERVFPDGKACDEGKVFNVWTDGSMAFADAGIGRCTVAEFPSAPVINLGLDKDIGTDFYCPPSSSTSMVIQSRGIMKDGSGITWFYRIPLECVSGTSYEYSICICGPGASTPVGPMPQSSPLAITVQSWDEKYGCGYEEYGSHELSPSYSLELSSVCGGKGSLTFKNIFGKTSVRSSDESVLQVKGCGKYWELFAVRKGAAVLDICNGISSAKETIQIE